MSADHLSALSIAVGVALVAVHVPCVAAPGKARAWAARFPRHTLSGLILAAVDLLWSGWLLFHTPLGRFEGLKPLLYVLTPLALFLVAKVMDDLLAARALGGLLLLVPTPLLQAARWHPSAFRYPVLVAAYALAVAGMALVLNPYLFRKTAERLLRSDASTRWCGWAGLAAGAALAILGLLVF